MPGFFFGYRPVPRPSLANQALSLAVNNDTEYSMPVGFKTAATETTAAAVTYTAKQLLGGIILRDPNGASRTDILPTCTLLAASFRGIVSGSSLDFSIKNTADADEIITLTVGAGMTAATGTSLTISRGETANFVLVFTISSAGVCTADLYRSSTAAQELPAPASMIATQASLITDGVTINSPQGVITTVTSTLAGTLSLAPIVLTNTYIRTTSVIVVGFEYATGLTGIPVVRIGVVSAGSATIIITNASVGVALNGPVKIHFRVFNA